MLKILIGEIIKLIDENITIIREYPYFKKNIKSVLKNDDLSEKIKGLYDNYINSTLYELKAYKMVLSNYKKCDYEDVDLVLDMIYDMQYDKDVFMEEVYDKLDYAISMEDEGLFYMPCKKPKYLDCERLVELKNILFGFSEINLERFLLNEELFSKDDLEYVGNITKKLDVSASENIDLFGVNYNLGYTGPKLKGIIVPKIKDQLSMLINVHEYAHVASIGYSDLYDDLNPGNEDIPRFYEGVYKLYNENVDYDINHTEISKKMLDEYKNEKFVEQIEKYKYYCKKLG